MTVPSTIVFVVGALGLLLVWRRHLTRPGRREFWRAIAFVCLLGLVCQNAPRWFVDPAAAPQLVSWVLLLLSGVLAAAAGRQLRVGGRPISGIEPTTELVTDGIYRYLRHPLYTSLLLLVVGVWLKNVSWASTAWGVGSGVAVWVTARREEAELGAQFGEAYRAYRARTKGYVPWVW